MSKIRNQILLIFILFAFVVLLFGCTESKSSSSERTSTADNKVKSNSYEKWWENGSLHKSTVADWKKADYQNKMGTAADWLAATDWKGHLNSLEDFDKMKIKADLFVKSIDNALVEDDIIDAEGIVTIASMILSLSNDLGP